MWVIAIAKHLTGLSIVTYDETLPTADCFIAKMPPEPDDAVMLMPVSGPKPDVKFGYDSPSLQVMTRAVKFRDGVEQADAIYNALQSLRTVTLDEGGSDEVRLLDCQAVQAPAYYLGTDDNGRHKWSQNFDLEIAHPTVHRL
ncbi:MAG: minor capsid protein [Thermoleophilia bacterium]